MVKLTLNPISSGFNSNTAFNDNFALIETAMEKTLSRDGTTPNTMEVDHDLNGHRVINLGEPTNSNDAARLVDVQAMSTTSLPVQTGHASQFLQSDGTVATWNVPAATEISNSPAGTIASTNVQAAINEIISDNASASGSSLIGFIQAGTGAVARTVQSKERDIVNVSDFSSFAAAVAATPQGGTLVLNSAVYDVNQVFTRSNIKISGAGMPYYNSLTGTTHLTGGTIIRGTFGFLGDNVTVENLGVDCGVTACNDLNGGTAMDALVFTDATRTTHYNVTVKNIVTLAKAPSSAVHNFLLEGLSDSYFENLHAKYGQWGVVLKTINSSCNGVVARACSQAGFTFKSDTGVSGSPALKSSASNIIVLADDCAGAAQGILIYAATSTISDFELTNFYIDGYNATTPSIEGLKLVCDTRAVNINLIFNVNISNGTIYGQSTYGLSTFGAISNTQISNVQIKGVTSNTSINIQSDSLGVSLVNVIANAPVANVSNVYLSGRFSFDNLKSYVNGDYNSPSGINLVPESASTFKVGSYLGTIGINGVQTWTPTFTGLTVVNGTGAATITGNFVIRGNRIVFNVLISVTGTCTTASNASTTYINNLPYNALKNSTLNAVNGVVTSYGTGLIQSGGTNGFTPTWAAYNGSVIISGEYPFQA